MGYWQKPIIDPLADSTACVAVKPNTHGLNGLKNKLTLSFNYSVAEPSLFGPAPGLSKSEAGNGSYYCILYNVLHIHVAIKKKIKFIVSIKIHASTLFHFSLVA